MAVIQRAKERESVVNTFLSCHKQIFFIIFVLLLVVSLLNIYSHHPPSTTATYDKTVEDQEEEAVVNSMDVKEWRNWTMSKCESSSRAEFKSALEEGFRLPTSLRGNHIQDRDTILVKRCKYVVIDFGTNVGDSIIKFVDSGLPGCTIADIAEPVVVSFAEEKGGLIIESGRWNGLSRYFKKRMTELGNIDDRGPEDYCVYGIEGNPLFTSRLQTMENLLMNLSPRRPFRHLHIFTETVGAAKNGMTTMYLDTVNEDKNFWGSSILATHRDVTNRAADKTDIIRSNETEKSTENTATANVMGVSLSSLMRQTLTAFGTDGDKTGGHLLIKIDIEGGEYQLLNECYDSGVICDYIQMGNIVDVIVEFHTENLIGKNDDLRRYHANVKHRLTECGVNFKRLPPHWA